MPSQHNEEEINIANYVVAYIDVLGQRDRLRDFPSLILNLSQQEIERLSHVMRDTYGRVHAVRELFKAHFKEPDTQAEDSAWYKSLSQEQQEEFQRVRYGEIQSQQFSDAIVFYAPLRNVRGALSLVPIVQMFWACAMSMLINLARKIAVRGGIEIGAAANWPRFGIYGSAYYNAYDLESNVAKYPRIVVGDELMRYFRLWRQHDGTDNLACINRKFVEYCDRMICEDVDGRWIIDFLSEHIPVLFGHDKHEETLKFLREKRDEGFRFVIEEQERYKRNRDSDLTFRYAYLLDYYVARSKNQECAKGQSE